MIWGWHHSRNEGKHIIENRLLASASSAMARKASTMADFVAESMGVRSLGAPMLSEKQSEDMWAPFTMVK
jgi:hypothetical protein